MTAINDDLLRCVIHIYAKVGAVANQLFEGIHKAIKNSVGVVGLLATGFADAVVGKCDRLLGEFENWQSIVALAPDSTHEVINKLIVLLILNQRAGLQRRVQEPFSQRFPLKILWMQKTPPHKPCEHRQRIAREILKTPENMLECTVLKIRRLFGRDLALAARDGTTGLGLFALLRCLDLVVFGEVEAVDGA